MNVYRIAVDPGDTVLLHHHEHDAVSVMLDGATVTVHSPGKPDVHQSLNPAQVRLQPNGYTRSTEIMKDSKPYSNVTLELLIPQTNYRNLCAQVIAGQPLNCPSAGESGEAKQDVPQFETDQTRVILKQISPQQTLKVGSASDEEVFVTLDDVTVGGKQLHSGDFMWLAKGSAARTLKNDGSGDARVVLFALKPKM